MTMLNFPEIFQEGDNDCGYICIKIICKYYKINFIEDLISKNRLSIYEVVNSLLLLKLQSIAIIIDNIENIHKLHYPFICLLNKSHYVVVYKSTKNIIYISDPLKGKINIRKKTFEKLMFNNIDKKGKIILINKSS